MGSFVASALPAVATSPETVNWVPCPSDSHPDKQCARVPVPRVYGEPQRGTVRIALARIPATGPAELRIGSLFWDAGGPGGASTEMIDPIADLMSPAIRARFDFVAFDPRGIGASTPTLGSCGGPWPIRPARVTDPDWRKVQARSAAALAQDNRACARRARDVAGTMGTSNVVRDLDLLRKAVGDHTLTFWATSYGTRIGYVYAHEYPSRVRAIVLDGNIDPSSDYAGLARIGGTSQDIALRFIRNHYRPAYKAIVHTAAELTRKPVRLEGGGRFTRWNWLDLVGSFVAFQDAWAGLPGVASVVQLAQGTGERAEAMRRKLASWKAMPNTNEGGGFSVVNCLDYAQRLTGREESDIAATNARRHPVFGGSLSLMYALGCRGLGSLEPDPIPLITTDRQRARLADVPVLLANATHDGSTPMAWAKSMQDAFDRPMIEYRSSQHVIWGATKSECVNRPIDRFVITVQEPKHDRTCPFVPSEPGTAGTALSVAGLGRLR